MMGESVRTPCGKSFLNYMQKYGKNLEPSAFLITFFYFCKSYVEYNMRRTIHQTYDKSLIGGLTAARFPGKIVVILSEHEADKAVEYLRTFPMVGIDTETRPSFRKGSTRKVALLQVATHEVCFLFRLNHLGLPPSVIALLEDASTLKIGLSLHDDLLSLRRRAGFEAVGFIDLQDCMEELGIADKSLQKLYANFFGRRISKRQQLSNWENDILTDKQKDYAATDAWACLELYEEYRRLLHDRDFDLIVTPQSTTHETATAIVDIQPPYDKTKKHEL